MKNITFLLAVLLFSINSYAQVIVNLTSVPCNTNIEGLQEFTYAGELDGSSTDWSCPNMYDVNSAVSGILEMINDSTAGSAQSYITNGGAAPHPSPPLAPSIPASALGCDTLGNISQDLTGKIAVIYRGACEFGLKALNAQKRGAIAVIIINHTGDPVPMAGGVYGVRITIPVVMIGRVAGDDLYLALQNCAPNTVTGFIGSKAGVYTNDMGSSIGDFLMPNELAKPRYLAYNGTQYPIDLGLWVYNYGTNSQNGVTINVNVQKKSDWTTIYNQTSLPLNFNGISGGVIDSQYIDLGTCAPSNWSSGLYLVTYSINNSNDEETSDNTFSFEFNLTGGFYNGIYSKSRTDVLSQPLSSTSYYVSETQFLMDNWESCIVFKDANVGNVYALATGLTFSCTPVGNQMDFEVVEARLYKWNDVFSNIDTPPTFNTLSQVTQGTYFYDYWSNGNLSGQNIYLPFDYPYSLNNNQRYLFCVYTASDSVKLGFDNQINYKTTINHYREPISPFKIMPNGGAEDWSWEGVGFNLVPAIAAHIETVTDVKEDFLGSDITPFPNPATNLLTVPIRKKISGNVFVEVFDLAGKLVLSENKTIGNEPLKLNVSSIPNGAYLFKLNFSDGTHEQFKVSVNR